MSETTTHSREVTEANSAMRALAGNIKLGANGLAPQTMAELLDFAQLMARAGPMIGKAFRNNPGACLGITMQAMAWNMSPFAVSQKAYVTTDKSGAEQIGYEAQLVTAVINAHAPVVERPKYRFTGEGPERQCIVTATLKGESEACIYTSPEIGTITIKNSPLWRSDPDQQLGYYSIRAWARRYCPEVIMGVYTTEELTETVEVTGSERIVDRSDSQDASDDPITEEQAEAIRTAIATRGADIALFCNYMGVEAVPQLLQRDYQRGLDAIAMAGDA